MDNEKAASKFWKALAKGDGKAMAKCYADDAHFVDPVFDVQGDDVGKMWRKLMDGKSDIIITQEPLSFEGDTAKGYWRATYTFTPTGNKVENHIYSVLQMKDGKIVAHADKYSFYHWARQALGTQGAVFGWTPIVKKRVRTFAKQMLED